MDDDGYYQIQNTNYNKILPQLLQGGSSPFQKDFTLVCEKKELQAHKLILAAHCSFFEDMFIRSPALNVYYFLPSVSFEDLEVFLEYVYTGEFTYRRSRLHPLMELFYSLKVRGFVDFSDGVAACEARIAALFQNSGNVHNRENLNASANAGLNDQPAENNDHQASTSVVNEVHEDNDCQDSLLPAATVDQGVYNVLDQVLLLVPLPVDQMHNIQVAILCSPESEATV